MDDVISRQDAIDAAIEAVDEWGGDFNFTRACIIKKALNALPPSQPEVIRCKDCRWHKDQSMAPMWLPCSVINTTNNYYCADAERKYDE